MKELMDDLSWWFILLLCITLGLAPFKPPHVFEKLVMLMSGKLVRPVDWFDLLLHGFPWVLLILKLIYFKK